MRTLVKELGKLDPQLREKGRLTRVSKPEEAAEKCALRLFNKNTGLCKVENDV